MNLLRNRNSVITYTVNKAVNANFNISVQNGEVVINAPWYTTNNQIQKVINEKKEWIINKLSEYEQNCEKKKEYTKLKTVKVLGTNYDLKVNYKNLKAPSLEINNQDINVILPS